MAGSPVRYEKDAENVVTITFDAPGVPVNTMTEEWQAAFTETVARLAQEKASIKGVILASAKKAGLRICANVDELEDFPTPKRLPECSSAPAG